jgi:hypothetical protein
VSLKLLRGETVKERARSKYPQLRHRMARQPDMAELATNFGAIVALLPIVRVI